jgi:hypothetical protein
MGRIKLDMRIVNVREGQQFDKEKSRKGPEEENDVETEERATKMGK